MYLDTQYHSDLTAQEAEEEIMLHVKDRIPCRMLSKFTFEKEIDAFTIEINLRKVKWL